MFCPNCGAEDQKQSQFCRACGTELRVVRAALHRPDAITTSAMTARDEIGQAIAAKIKELRTADDLKEVVEDVLPQVEKFLESPEERRLRRLHEGTLTTATGLGIILFCLIMNLFIDSDRGETLLAIGGGGGLLVLLIGLGLVINSRWLTALPQKAQPLQRISKQIISGSTETDPLPHAPSSIAPGSPSKVESVIEGTTRQLR